MWSQARFKKEAERRDLDNFLDARAHITRERLEVVEATERPDFICKRADAQRVGVELTKVTRGNPKIMMWDRILERRHYMRVDSAIEALQLLATEKERKRTQYDWKHSSSTILLLQLVDIPLSRLKGQLTNRVVPDLENLGFAEMWIADYTQVEPYDNIELVGFCPEKWFGYHQRPNPLQKPYG